jgi:hypothetical protein
MFNSCSRWNKNLVFRNPPPPRSPTQEREKASFWALKFRKPLSTAFEVTFTDRPNSITLQCWLLSRGFALCSSLFLNLTVCSRSIIQSYCFCILMSLFCPSTQSVYISFWTIPHFLSENVWIHYSVCRPHSELYVSFRIRLFSCITLSLVKKLGSMR